MVTVLVQQIDPAIIVALIGVFAGVLPVGITYIITKNKEINANIRQEKTKRYDSLIDALAMIVSDIYRKPPNTTGTLDIDVVSVNKFINAYNRASTYSSDLVLERCNDLTLALGKREAKITQVRNLIIGVYEAIRLDINPKAKYTTIAAISISNFQSSDPPSK